VAYASTNGRKPMEMASKTSHSHIIRHVVVQEFLQVCNIPQPPDSEVVSLQVVPVEPPIEDRVRLVITIDGGFTEVSIQERFPSSSYTFYNFGGLLFEKADLQTLHEKPFIDPEDMAKLRNIQRFPFVLPTKNICLNHCASLVESVRWSIFDFFRKPYDGEKPLMYALRWLLFQEYNPNIANRMWVLASCPTCHEPHIQIPAGIADQLKCPACSSFIYLTDVFRLHEAVDNEQGAGGILGYLMAVLEQMLLVHLVKTVWEMKKNLLPEILFVRDGPLAFFGQTANMHEPMRRLMNYLTTRPNSNGQGTMNYMNLVGVEKSGPFVEHANTIHDSIPPGHALILNNDYIYRYITPGAGDPSQPFGRTSYYGSKVIFKAIDGNVYVLTLPSLEPLLNPTISDLGNFNLVLYNIAKLKCHMYDNALVPVALVNKLVSLSDHPSRKILSAFAKAQTAHSST
jgi:NurA domain